MAKLKTRNIFVGDSFEVKYRCWRHLPVQERRTAFGGTEQNIAREPVQPVAVKITLVNYETNEIVPLENGAAEATLTPTSHEFSYVIDRAKLMQEGTYRVYTRVTFDDGNATRNMTEVIQFRVQAIGNG